jgi:multicomponent K+:H+ antiporter subunit F
MSPLLSGAITVTLTVYGLAILMMMWRLLRGPSAQDRVMALDVIYVVGMLIALVVGIRYTSSMYFEAALLIALFGFVSSAARAKFLLRGEVIE